MSGLSPAQAVISAMITPALLILASGSLIATALVRLARVVDRIRKLAEAHGERWVRADLERQQRRAMLAERAVSCFFFAVTCFVVSGFTIAADHALGDRSWWLPVAVTTLGMILIVCGCAAMIAETRLSLDQIRAEIARVAA